MKACSPERTLFAELLRAYYLGRITNWQLEDAGADPWQTEEMLFTFFHQSAWCSYSDNREYKFTDNENYALWPFRDHESFELALRSPPYLFGHSRLSPNIRND